MGWTYWSVETHTGNKLSPIPARFNGTVMRGLNLADDPARCTVPATHPDWADVDLGDLVTEMNRLVVMCLDDQPMHAWQIEKSRYRASARSWDLVLRPMADILDGRALIGAASTYPSHSYYKFGPASYSTIADRVVREVAENNAEIWDNLPILYPPFIAGSEEMRYYGYNAMTVLDALEELTEVSGGPDLDFRPVWNGDRFAWQMDAHPSLNYGLQIDAHVGAGGITDVEYERDGAVLATRAFVFGEGTGRETISAAATVGAGQAYATNEQIHTGKRTKTLAHVQGHAARIVDRYGKPAEWITGNIRRDGTPGLRDLRLGMKVVLQTSKKDPVLKGRNITARLAGYSFAPDSPTVGLDLLIA